MGKQGGDRSTHPVWWRIGCAVVWGCTLGVVLGLLGWSSQQQDGGSINAVPPSIPSVPEEHVPAHCHGKGNLLIVQYGLLRTFRATWPQMRAQLGVDEWAACPGARVDVVISSKLDGLCTPRDAPTGACQRWNRHARQTKLTILQTTFSPYFKMVVEPETGNDADMTNSFWFQVKGKGMFSLWQLFQRLDRSDFPLHHYDTVIAYRNDVMFDPHSARLDLAEVCRAKPGFNLMHGRNQFHGCFSCRDIDFGFLMCGNQAVRAAFIHNETCVTHLPACRAKNWTTTVVNDDAHARLLPPLSSDWNKRPQSPKCIGPWRGPSGYVCDMSIMCDDRLDPLGAYQFWCDLALRMQLHGQRLGNLDVYNAFLRKCGDDRTLGGEEAILAGLWDRWPGCDSLAHVNASW